jgi:hypothetical protein
MKKIRKYSRMFSYLFKKKEIVSPNEFQIGGFVKIPEPTINTKVNKITYLVVDKNSLNPIGIFNNLAHAKKSGETLSYNNCIIYEYILNDPCKYLSKIVYESK